MYAKAVCAGAILVHTVLTRHAYHMTSAPPHTSPRILLVDDDPVVIQTLRPALAGLGTLYFASCGAEAVQMMNDVRPDIVLLDAELPDLTGFEVLSTLHDDPGLADVPVLFVTRFSDQEVERAALELGAVDFITKPVRPAIVAMRVKTHLRLKSANERLRRLADHDPLTGLANRRVFDEALEREWGRCRRSYQPISLLMIDVDHFKRFNDHYGHGAGDRCLTAVAGMLRACLHRPFDLVARYGGEEFAVLLPDTDRQGALHVGERILSTLAAMALPNAGSERFRHVTVSVGATSYDAECASWLCTDGEELAIANHRVGARDLFTAADLALYAAKHGGRAQQCFRAIDAAATTDPRVAS